MDEGIKECSSSSPCVVCGKPATLRCGRCKARGPFCSAPAACQRTDWATHRATCKKAVRASSPPPQKKKAATCAPPPPEIPDRVTRPRCVGCDAELPPDARKQIYFECCGSLFCRGCARRDSTVCTDCGTACPRTRLELTRRLAARIDADADDAPLALTSLAGLRVLPASFFFEKGTIPQKK